MTVAARTALLTPPSSSSPCRPFFRRRDLDAFLPRAAAPLLCGDPRGCGDAGARCADARMSMARAALDTVGREGARWAFSASSFIAHESHTRTGSLKPKLGSARRLVEHSAQKMPPHLRKGGATCA